LAWFTDPSIITGAATAAATTGTTAAATGNRRGGPEFTAGTAHEP